MCHAIWHHDHIALGELPGFTVTNARSAEFVGSDLLGIDSFASGYECGQAIEHINHVSVFRVNFSLPGLFPTARVHHVIAAIASIEQDCALGEGSINLALIEIAD